MPSGVTLMLAGLRSRWTMPFSWAASSRGGDLAGVVDGGVDRDGSGEVGALDQFHHQVIRTDVVERADVGMIERRNRARLALKASAELFVRRLDGHVASQARVAG